MPNPANAISMTKAEAEFRAMAFRIVYDGVYATVDDLTTRFACAIAYSARAINDVRLFESWWAWTRGRSIKGLLASGNEPPAELRPFVDSYLLAVGERARETGDTLHDLI